MKLVVLVSYPDRSLPHGRFVAGGTDTLQVTNEVIYLFFTNFFPEFLRSLVPVVNPSIIIAET